MATGVQSSTCLLMTRETFSLMMASINALSPSTRSVSFHVRTESRMERYFSPSSRWEAPPAFPNREAAKAYVEPRVADEEELARQLGRDIEAWDPQSTQRLFDWREPDEKRLRKRCALELN